MGITIDVIPIHPLTGSEADLVATRVEDGFRNRWILDPVLRGGYPEDLTRRFARILPTVEDGDLEAISAPIDFLGVNYYRRHVVKAGPNGSGPVVVDVPDGEHTAVGWEVYPDGLHELLVRLAVDAGLDASRARAILAGDEYAEEVRERERLYTDAGIHSVPAIVINNQHLISGGQPPEVFERALRQIAGAQPSQVMSA